MSRLPFSRTDDAEPGIVARILDSDIFYSFCQSKLVVLAAIITALYFLAALCAPLIAPHHPFDLAALDLMDALTPPAWSEGGVAKFPIGTDDQGRDLWSAILYGLRISLAVGFASVGFAAVMGISLGLVAGYFGGFADTIIMRFADIQMTFPNILVALLIDGTVAAMFPELKRENSAFWILVLVIGLSFWVQYARTVRSSVLVEKEREYVQAATLVGSSSISIMFRQILPNVLSPVLIIMTINLALAIIAEATLSYLGVGIPATQPSLGTLIRIGQDFLFSGEWWITFFPGLVLAVLVLSVNLLGDWLRDALNPKLR